MSIEDARNEVIKNSYNSSIVEKHTHIKDGKIYLNKNIKMTLKEYAIKVRETAIYPNIGNNHLYPCLGIIGEFGELVSKVNVIGGFTDEDFHLGVKQEIGDCFWYIIKAFDELGEEITDINLEEFYPENCLDIGICYIGYIAEALKKCIRDDNGLLNEQKKNKINENVFLIRNLLISFILFMSYNLDEILQMNIDKLQSRKERNVLKGSGDNR